MLTNQRQYTAAFGTILQYLRCLHSNIAQRTIPGAVTCKERILHTSLEFPRLGYSPRFISTRIPPSHSRKTDMKGKNDVDEAQIEEQQQYEPTNDTQFSTTIPTTNQVSAVPGPQTTLIEYEWEAGLVTAATRMPDTGDSLESRDKFRDAGRVHWLPSHQRKTIATLNRLLHQKADLIVEVRDARIPLTSTNTVLDHMSGHAPRLIVFNKADLCMPYDRTILRKHLLARYNAHAVWTDNLNGESTRNILHYALELHKQFPQNYPTIEMLLAGVPNTGKSTLINSLISRRKGSQKTGAYAGVTRAVQNKMRIHKDPNVYLVDTPGVFDIYCADGLSKHKIIATGGVSNEAVDIIDTARYIHYRLNNSPLLRKTYPSALGLSKKEQIDDFHEFLAEVSIARGYRADNDSRENRHDMEVKTRNIFTGETGSQFSLALSDDYFESFEYDTSECRTNRNLAARYVLTQFQRGFLGRITLDDMSEKNVTHFFEGTPHDPNFVDTLGYKISTFDERQRKLFHAK